MRAISRDAHPGLRMSIFDKIHKMKLKANQFSHNCLLGATFIWSTLRKAAKKQRPSLLKYCKRLMSGPSGRKAVNMDRLIDRSIVGEVVNQLTGEKRPQRSTLCAEPVEEV